MSDILLSICIPTYNRAEILKKTLESIVKQDTFVNSTDVQIVISNNCSTDNTDEVAREFKLKFPDKIKYINQQKPVEPDEHNFKVIEYADGIFGKINNDTCMFKDGSLSLIVDFLRNNKTIDSVFFCNRESKSSHKAYKVDSFSDFLSHVSYNVTWIGGLCINKTTFLKIENPLRYKNLKLPQVDIYGRLFENQSNIYVLDEHLFDIAYVPNKGGDYNISEVFGKNYFCILSNFLKDEIPQQKLVLEKEKKKILPFINKLYFDFNKRFSYTKTGYFKNMLPLYKCNLYFWIRLLGLIAQFIFSLILRTQKDDKYKTYIFVNMIKYKKKRKQKG